MALLRGINVGGNKLVNMAELRACFEKLGFKNVQTHINSGNVIFKTKLTDPRLLETTIETALYATFSHRVAVVVRSFNEIQRLISQIPRSWSKPASQKCNVIFLRHSVDNRKALEGLSAKPGIEELDYFPGVLFWSAKTSDLTKSNMLKINRLGIYKEMTVRNLNSTRKIYEIMATADKNT